MDEIALEKLKYPIGKYTAPEVVTEVQLKEWIKEFGRFPAKLKALAETLTPEQLATTYRPGGWTLKQVINHLADSHSNAYIRVKLALTEENPTIKPYFEERWAETEDGKNGAVSASLMLLEGVHQRLTACFISMGLADFNRTYFHPEHQQSFDLKYLLGMYVWHGEHHYMQIANTVS